MSDSKLLKIPAVTSSRRSQLLARLAVYEQKRKSNGDVKDVSLTEEPRPSSSIPIEPPTTQTFIHTLDDIPNGYCEVAAAQPSVVDERMLIREQLRNRIDSYESKRSGRPRRCTVPTETIQYEDDEANGEIEHTYLLDENGQLVQVFPEGTEVMVEQIVETIETPADQFRRRVAEYEARRRSAVLGQDTQMAVDGTADHSYICTYDPEMAIVTDFKPVTQASPPAKRVAQTRIQEYMAKLKNRDRVEAPALPDSSSSPAQTDVIVYSIKEVGNDNNQVDVGLSDNTMKVPMYYEVLSSLH